MIAEKSKMIKPEPSIKFLLHKQCLAYIDQCIQNVQLAIDDARQSGNNETKSSAGDKHETGRALLQLEQEKNTKQLAEMTQVKDKLLKIDPSITSGIVSSGSVVLTDRGNFYIAVAAGKMEVEKEIFFTVSTSAPLAMKLLGLKAGDRIQLNAQTYEIRYVL